MTAKRAAEALYLFDCDLKNSIDDLNEEDYWWIQEGGRERGLAIVRTVVGTWTLSIVAHAANQTEEAVLTALYKNHLHGGTMCVASGEIKNMLSSL